VWPGLAGARRAPYSCRPFGVEIVPQTHLRAWSAGVLLLAGCMTQTATTAAHPEAVVPSHLYAHLLDDVLQQAQALLVQKGWKVQRFGDELATNWVHVEAPAPRSEDGPVAPLAARLRGPGLARVDGHP
jgi:hypothetical protein